MHAIGFFICPQYELLDLAGPLSAFTMVRKVTDRPTYEVHVLSEAGGVLASSSGVRVETEPYRSIALDTVIFVGGNTDVMRAPGAVEAAKYLGERTARVASVCTGAYLLAEAGFLNGHRATTHWIAAPDLQQCYPSVKVEADSIFISDNGVWTSAGVAAGMDLALALIEADHGAAVAKDVARLLVIPYRRSGGQSQFSQMSQMEPVSDRIRAALNFAREHLSEPLPIERLADAAHLGVRQFGRAFRSETGETPAKAVERLRAEAAKTRLQDGSESIEQIARAVGFADPERMRRAFVKLFGMSPQAIRRSSRKVA